MQEQISIETVKEMIRRTHVKYCDSGRDKGNYFINSHEAEEFLKEKGILKQSSLDKARYHKAILENIKYGIKSEREFLDKISHGIKMANAYEQHIKELEGE